MDINNQSTPATDNSQFSKNYVASCVPEQQPMAEEDLKSQLLRILAMECVLPSEHEKPILGWELVNKIKPLLMPGYSDNSVKNYFSQLSKIESSPIAKKANSFGYFRRKSQEEGNAAIAVNDAADSSEEQSGTKRDGQMEEKWREIYMAYLERERKFPAHIEHTKSLRAEKGVNLWKFPDVITLEWDVGVLTQIEDKLVLDNNLLLVKKASGHSPFTIISSELKVFISLSNFRQYFFQCLSNSNWAHETHLIIATRIEDSKLVESLKKLGQSFSVSIYSFNLDAAKLDKLPSADKIRELKGVDREKIVDKFCSDVTVIHQAQKSILLDWDHIQDVRAINNDFNRILKWIPKCLTDEMAYSLQAFKDKEDEEYKLKYMYEPNYYKH